MNAEYENVNQLRVIAGSLEHLIHADGYAMPRRAVLVLQDDVRAIRSTASRMCKEIADRAAIAKAEKGTP